jgi:hypothetical protein
MQDKHTAGTDAPAIAVGETIVITTGIISAPSPSRRIALRRDMPAFASGSTIACCNSWALLSLFIANQTASSFTGVRHCCSISFAISAAVV